MANKFKLQHVTLFFFSRLCGIAENCPNVNFQKNIAKSKVLIHMGAVTQTCLAFMIVHSLASTS